MNLFFSPFNYFLILNQQNISPPSTSISFTTGGDSTFKTKTSGDLTHLPTTHLTSSNFVEALIDDDDDDDDDTLPNFIKRKHPKKGREKETKGKDPKSRQASS